MEWSVGGNPIGRRLHLSTESITYKAILKQLNMWKRVMHDFLGVLVFVAVWIALQRFVLPRLGVST